MLSLVNSTNSALGNMERSLGYTPGTFIQHAKSASYAAMVESFIAGINGPRPGPYPAGGYYAPPGQYMNGYPQGYYAPPPTWGIQTPRPQTFLGLVSSIGSSAIRSYLNTPGNIHEILVNLIFMLPLKIRLELCS